MKEIDVVIDERRMYNPNTGITYVMLTSDDILKCIKLSGDFSKYEAWGGSDASKRDDPNNYGAGILNTTKDKYKCEREGAFGEVSFSILSGLLLDEEIRASGNDWDFVIPYRKEERYLDVKNTQEFKLYFDKGEFIIRNSNWKYGKKKICPLKADAYFFTSDRVFLTGNNERVHNFRPVVSKIIMRMHGAISAKRVEENREERVSPSPWGSATWDNIYVKDEELTRPIDFFSKVGLDVPSFLEYEDCLNGLWKGLESYV